MVLYNCRTMLHIKLSRPCRTRPRPARRRGTTWRVPCPPRARPPGERVVLHAHQRVKPKRRRGVLVREANLLCAGARLRYAERSRYLRASRMADEPAGRNWARMCGAPSRRHPRGGELAKQEERVEERGLGTSTLASTAARWRRPLAVCRLNGVMPSWPWRCVMPMRQKQPRTPRSKQSHARAASPTDS